MTHWIKRLFIPRREMESKVKDAAFTHFCKYDPRRTRQETGVLLVLSLHKKRTLILGDES